MIYNEALFAALFAETVKCGCADTFKRFRSRKTVCHTCRKRVRAFQAHNYRQRKTQRGYIILKGIFSDDDIPEWIGAWLSRVMRSTTLRKSKISHGPGSVSVQGDRIQVHII